MSYPNITQDIQELQAFQANLINLVYPVGSIYMSVNNVSPATFLGGTWVAIQDTFLLSAGSKHSAGSTGGEETHTLSVAETPAHTHTRGTMEIIGSFCNIIYQYFSGVTKPDVGAKGAFTHDGPYGGGGGAGYPTSQSFYSDSSVDGIKFTASRNWTGATSSVGGNAAHNNMPPYVQVSVWRRTA
jgi:hypothetical protein